MVPRTCISTYFLLFFLLLGKFSTAQQTTFPNHFTVSQDGSGDFKTIQEAVNAVRDFSQQRVRIDIKPGVYQEKLVIPSWKTNISLIGEDAENTIITYSDHSGKAYPNNGVDAFGKKTFNTFNSYTVLVQGNDFTAEGLTFQNAAGRVGQAVALHVEADRVIIKNCRLLGNQDTLYVAKDSSRQLYQHCYIEGTTDFIFGEATVVFEDCTIKSLHNSYVTAASTTSKQAFGFVFFNCKLIADPSIQKVFLGRPWRPHAKTVFLHCYLDKQISPLGWDNWRNPENEKTAYFAEYDSQGSGANPQGRVTWSKQLSKAEAEAYTIERIFDGDQPWTPRVNPN